MTTIELGNLYSIVKDASPRATLAIDGALAVETPGHEFTATYKSGMWDGMTRFYRKQSGKFPTGLLSEVVKALRRLGEEPEIVDTRKTVPYNLPSEIKLAHAKLGHIILRDYQYESVQKALLASRGIINVATNGGKTEIACGIIQSILPNLKKDERVVFFTHAKEIFGQSHKRLEERLGIKVGKIGDGKWDEQQVTIVMIPTIQKYLKEPKELPKVKKLKDLQETAEICYRALKICKDTQEPDKKIAEYQEKLDKARKELDVYKKEQWDKIKASVKKTKAFMKSVVAFLGDEVHHASSDTWYKVFMDLDKAYYRFGLTGTIDESEPIGLKRLLGCTGKVVIKVTNDFLISRGYSAKPTVYMLPIPAPVINYNYQDARVDGIITNSIRNQVFIDKIRERADSGKQCLIIVNETEHGNIVSEMLEYNGVEAEFIHGKCTTKKRDTAMARFASGEIRVLVATPILDEGVDVPNINCLFIMAGGKSMRQLLQRIGRGLREKHDGSGLEVYDALDYHNEYLVDHTMERYMTYKDEGFEVIKLDM